MSEHEMSHQGHPEDFQVNGRPLFKDNGDVDPPALAVLVYRLDATMLDLSGPLRGFFEAETRKVEARTKWIETVTGWGQSPIVKPALAFTLLTISAAILNSIGLPIEDGFRWLSRIVGLGGSQ